MTIVAIKSSDIRLADEAPTSRLRTVKRVLLGGFLVFAGVTHLTVARDEFKAQVPKSVTRYAPLTTDQVVLASGVAEIALGLSLLFARRAQRPTVGWVAAAFFAAVFPGNLAQFVHRRDAFGLDTDKKRFLRLFFQPVLIAWSPRRGARRRGCPKPCPFGGMLITVLQFLGGWAGDALRASRRAQGGLVGTDPIVSARN